MVHRIFFALASFTAFLSSVAAAQTGQGPEVPCVGCDLGATAYPETGVWDNPDQSGSGFVIEIQNGVLVAYYFGYDDQGDADWFLFTAPLVASDKEGVTWESEGQPTRLSGGNCLGCDYAAPTAESAPETLRFEFLQRAHARMILADGSEQYLVPYVYGSAAQAYLPEETPYGLPTMREGQKWVFTFDSLVAPGQFNSHIAVVGEALGPEDHFRNEVVYITRWDEIFSASIVCGPDQLEEDEGVVCIYESFEGDRYIIPYANFTDTRIEGIREGGAVKMTAYRLHYD